MLKEKIAKRLMFQTKSKNLDDLMDFEFEYLLLLSKILDFKTPQTLVEATTQFIWVRRFSKYILEKNNVTHKGLCEYKNRLERFVSENKLGNSSMDELDYDDWEFVTNTKEMIQSYEKDQDVLNTYVEILDNHLQIICEFLDDSISFNDFCSLLNINPIIAKQNIEDLEKEDNIPLHYLYVWEGIEDDRSQEGWKHNRHGMPMFNLTKEAFLIKLKKNRELKKKVNEKMHEMFPELRSNMIEKTVNDNGEIVYQKHYPELISVK